LLWVCGFSSVVATMKRRSPEPDTAAVAPSADPPAGEFAAQTQGGDAQHVSVAPAAPSPGAAVVPPTDVEMAPAPAPEAAPGDPAGSEPVGAGASAQDEAHVESVEVSAVPHVPSSSSSAVEPAAEAAGAEPPAKLQKQLETDTASSAAVARRSDETMDQAPPASAQPPMSGEEGFASAAAPAPVSASPAAAEPAPDASPEQDTSESEDKSVKFENALDFLDQVKVQFSDRPKVYTQFLEIMKDFKAQLVDTPGVIARVQDLFRGHKRLILGFNTFLPTGYKMEYGDGTGLSVTTPQGVVHNIPLSRPGSLTGGVSAALPPESDIGVSGTMQPLPPVASSASAAVQPSPMMAGAPSGAVQHARKQPEFDHARNYVKKIKVRFAGQPPIYKAFLEILHTYHKEQHTIKDVYEQVAQLFQSHTDLLDEFQQFLPDPVAQGQQQSNNAAAAAAMAAREKHSRKSNSTGSRGRNKSGAGETTGKRGRNSKSAAAQAQQSLGGQGHGHAHHVPNTSTTADLRSQLSAQSAHVAALQLGAASGAGDFLSPLPAPEPLSAAASGAAATRIAPRGKYEELNFFFRVKQRLNPPVYFEFLKCLNLFSRNIVSRMELVLLVRDLFGQHRDLFSWFKQFIGFDDASMAMLENHDDRMRKVAGEPDAIRAEDVDLDRCRRFGPSYRALPRSVIPEQCSGQTDPMYASVLNDKWNSTASGSEDFGFKNLRKNLHEEILFKCEDDRFELDLIIEQQASCQKALQLIAKQISDLPTPAERVRFRLDRSLDILHVRVIERLYGEEANNVLQALYRAPAAVIPVLVARMREKDREWCSARKAWNATWREVTERNHYKSLDHQSFFFKNSDKKAMNPQSLLTQMREIHHADLRRRAQDGSAIGGSHHVFENMGDQSILNDSITVIRAAIARLVSKTEQPRTSTLLSHFVRPFFGLPMEADADLPMEAGNIPPPLGLFFGDEAFYVFFWLFQLLYSRLAKAKEMSIPSTSEVSKKQDVDTYLALLNPDQAKLRETTQSGKSDAYKAFLSNVLLPHVGPERLTGARASDAPLAVPGVAAVNSREAAVAYEEATRALFGSHAHILFTLEKLLQHIVQQLQALVSRDNHSRLLVLYSIEANRLVPGDAKLAEEAESSYYANCVDALTSAGERDDRDSNDSGSSTNSDRAEHPPTRAVRFAYDRARDPSAPPSLTITLFDSRQDPPKFVDFSAAHHTRWAEYVESYLHSSSSSSSGAEGESGSVSGLRSSWKAAQEGRVFLLRNARNLADQQATADDESAAVALDGVTAHSGLEARIALTTFQLLFVENTGDYMLRDAVVSRRLRPGSVSGHEERASNLESVVTRISGAASDSKMDD
jgi:paired amphipathic helix protein Sin3a